MENNPKQQDFQYTYSAKEQEEVKRIRAKYLEQSEDKMERLRRLDQSVTQKAQVVALVLGVLGVLVLGFGMSLILSELGAIFGTHRVLALPVGILCGVAGGTSIALAYPMYQRVWKRERERVAPEILRLTEELMK